MNCNSGNRKVLADALVESVIEIAKKYDLQDVVVHRDADPVFVAVRGNLKSTKKKEKDECIEFVLQISPDIARASVASMVGAEIAAGTDLAAHRAFDLSEIVAKDSVAHAAKSLDEDRCHPDDK